MASFPVFGLRALPLRKAALLSTGQRKLLRRRVCGDDATGADGRTTTDVQRSHQRRVGADESALTDHREVLVGAVVVTGDGAGADVGLRADLGIADVAQMRGLRASGQPGLLDLDEIAHLYAGGQLRTGPQPCKRA